MKCAQLHFRQGVENWRSYSAAIPVVFGHVS